MRAYGSGADFDFSRWFTFLAFSLIVIGALRPAVLCAAEVTLHGRVVNENEAPVGSARVVVRSAVSNATAHGSWRTQTDPTGAFTFSLPGPGDFLVSVEREGYYALSNRLVRVETGQELTLVINTVREVFQSANINAETSPLDLAQVQSQERLSGTEVNDIPFANSHSLRNSLQLLPDVVQDPGGGLHVNGSSENQVLYLLNGFNLTDPISGGFQTTLAVEGIRSVDLSSGRYSPEFGKGTAGVLAISTESGTDAFHYTATDFIPGASIQQGLHLGNWYPRFGVSGPIVRGTAWFSDTFDSEYSQTVISGLPSGQNTRSAWAGSNLLHGQVNLGPSNILFADFLVNVDNEGRVGLSPLNPVSTTWSQHNREYFGSIKDQVYFGRGVLVEFGYAHNDFSDAQSPQGQELYMLTPQGTSGNYFVNSAQAASRDEGLVHAYLPEFNLAGAHHLEAGADADLLRYNADFRRSGFEVIGLSGELLSETVFPVPATFRLNDTEMSSYLLDTWRVAGRLQFKLGIRQDWDRRIGATAWSPRLGFSWSPFESNRTRVSGGYALTHDAVTLDMLGRPFDQTALTTQYNSNGTPAGLPTPATFSIGNSSLALPRATNWNLDIDHQLFTHIYVAAKYLRRRGTDGFAFLNTLAPNAPPSLLPIPAANVPGVYSLTNLRRDNYDSVEFSIHQTFSGQYEWMAAYTRSRALSNAVLDPNQNQPLQLLPGLAPMPWDTPNRFLAWTYLPLPWRNWAFSALADIRSGFPFSVRFDRCFLLYVLRATFVVRG